MKRVAVGGASRPHDRFPAIKEDSPATLVCIVAILFDTALATLLALSAALLC